MTEGRTHTTLRAFDDILEKDIGPCIEWTGSTNNGYGRFARGGKFFYAHRDAYERAFGPIPDGLLVCHRCDNRICINPEHLFLGTHADNMADCTSKERQARGERSGPSKLTAAQVSDARRLHAEGISIGDLSRRLDVTFATVQSFIQRKTWRHVA